MKDEVLKYLCEEKKVELVEAERLFRKVSKYADIYNCFLHWLMVRDYHDESNIEVRGYTAEDIYWKAKFLDGIGVYNILVDLRDNYDATESIIQSGFEVL